MFTHRHLAPGEAGSRAILFAVNDNPIRDSTEILAQPIAFIFDLDGVLVHSMPLHTLAWKMYLADHGIDAGDIEGFMHGKRNPELVKGWFGDHVSDEEALEHGAAKERLFRELLLKEDVSMYCVPGVAEFLERHKDVPMAIGSNAEIANIDFILDQYGLRRYFRSIVNGYQVTRPKPFPDIYLEAARQLGYSAENCIVFEDSPPGVEAGIAAGMRVVGVETTPTEFQGIALKIKNFADASLESWLSTQMAGKRHEPVV